MIYIRGNRLDYDGWAEAGCTGWGYEDVLPFFKRSEDYSRGESEYHGAGGPLRVTADYEPHPLTRRSSKRRRRSASPTPTTTTA